MKRSFLLFLLLTLVTLPVSAQPSIDPGSPSSDLAVKR